MAVIRAMQHFVVPYSAMLGTPHEGTPFHHRSLW